MKMIIAAAALATLIASPALAQSYDRDTGVAAPGSVYHWPVYNGNAGLIQGNRAARHVLPSESFAQGPGAFVYHWPVYDGNGRLINDTWE